MQAESNSEAQYSSGEEVNSESENEEMIDLALVAVHDSEVSSSPTFKVPQKLDLNTIECNNNVGNGYDSIS